MSDPASIRLGHHPLWLETPAAEVVIEGNVLNGETQGAETVGDVLGFTRSSYEFQLFGFVGSIGEDDWMETCTSKASGIEITDTAIVHRDAAGETDRIVTRPRPLDA